MKKIKIIPLSVSLALLSGLFLTSCSLVGLDLQKDYVYEKKELDPHLNKTARQYLEDRGKNPVKTNDTVFKWMQLGIEYAGINLDEYEKPGRTFIFLHNDAIRVLDKGNVTKGLWFDLPKVVSVDPVTGIITTKPATKWEDYSKETVKNYFLYLILQGDYGFNNALPENSTLQTLLPAGTVASKESLLGYIVSKSTPPKDNVIRHTSVAGGNGFDPEGKINMKIVYKDGTPLRINDLVDNRSAGQIATNGQVHVYASTIWPFRYSHND